MLDHCHSRQRIPCCCSCIPFSTVSRPQPKRRSAWRAQPPHSVVATSAWNERRRYPVRRRPRTGSRRRIAQRIRPSQSPCPRRDEDRPRSVHVSGGQDSSVRGDFQPPVALPEYVTTSTHLQLEATKNGGERKERLHHFPMRSLCGSRPGRTVKIYEKIRLTLPPLKT